MIQKTMMYYLFVLILAVSCAGVTRKNPKVEYAGALRNMMHKGDLSAKIDLNSLRDKKNLFALGAVENLKGEVQVFNGTSKSTYVDNMGRLKFDESFDKKASLLVYSVVDKWQEYQIPMDVKTKQQFEEFLERQAHKHGLDLTSPFPFLLEGSLDMNSWHVINWDPNDKVHTHKKHIESGIHQKAKNHLVKMLGFYSQNHTGIFTHHTTNMHIHFVDDAGKSAGHSDDMTLGDKMILKLPVLK